MIVQLILISILLILLITLAVRLFRHPHSPLTVSPLFWPVIAILTSVIINLIFIPEGRPEALANSAGLLLTLLFLHLALALLPHFSLPLLPPLVASLALLSLALPASPLNLPHLPLASNLSLLKSFLSSTSLPLGVGLGNFSSFFTQYKPLALNATTLWDYLPATSSSALLTLLMTTGIVGLLAWGWYFFQLLRLSYKHSQLASYLVLTTLFVLTPDSTLLYLLLLLAPALSLPPAPRSLPLQHRFVLPSVALSLALLLGYVLIPPLLPTFYLQRVARALSAQDSQSALAGHAQAIRAYPSLSLPHLSASFTNLQLALALSRKTSPTESDLTTIATLSSAAIHEAQTSIRRRPHDFQTHLVLARTYAALTPASESAGDLAVTSYLQAIRLNPGDPSLHRELSNLYTELGNQQQAEYHQTLARQLKPD